MNADAITAKILEDARAQAAAALSEAQERATTLQRQNDENIRRRQEEIMKQADASAAEMRDRMLRMAELDQKKALLAAKREIIDQAFSSALHKMKAMDSQRKAAYIESLLLDSAQGGEELIPCAADKALFDEKFMARLNDALKKAGKAPVALSKTTRPMEGGFVLKQGGLEINCAFGAVLQQARTALEAEVAGVLFN